MSFILDALKKSENDRQEQAEAEFASVPSSPDSPSTPRWLWVLGILLAVNIVVLIGLFLRPSATGNSAASASRPPAQTQPSGAQPATERVAAASAGDAQAATNSSESFSAQVANARENQPVVASAAPSLETRPAPATNDLPFANSPAVSVDRLPVSASASLPSFAEVVANGTLSLPDLRIDIHVYSDIPEDRFVFINMNKYNENATLAEGPEVREITTDGVILEHFGTAFVLPRD